MKHPYFKNFRIRLFALCSALIVTALFIHSCKKESSQANITNPNVVLAKAWYEKTYPVNTNTKLNFKSTYPANSNTNGSKNGIFDFSQYIKPDWQHTSGYTRFNDKVIEMPVDPANKITTGLDNKSGGGSVYKKQFSRSSFLLLNDGANYQAYIMTIIADSAYLKNDLTKLGRNKYNMRENDFSGVVLYFTPDGKFVSSWFYQNGNISKALLSSGEMYTPAANPYDSTVISNLKVNSSGLTNKNNRGITRSLNSRISQPLEEAAITFCQDWYQTVTADGVTYGPTYLGTTCTTAYYDTGSGGGSPITTGNGSGGTAPAPPPCAIPSSPSVSTEKNGHFAIDVAQPLPPPIDGSGFPPPTSNPCTTASTPAAVLQIKTDSLNKYFPCAVSLIINNLAECGAYGTLVEPFTTSRRPDLVWQNGALPWNVNGTYQLGQTARETSGIGTGATITLNTSMLQRSSMLLIEAAAIHETLHSYINYNVSMAADNKTQGYMTTGTWLYALDSWISIYGLPSNYSNHYQMLSAYFNLAVNALATLDNNAHTTKDYAMALLYGLNNASDGTPTEQALLQTEFNNILASYGITAAQLNTFNIANLNAPTSSRLPTNCPSN